MQRYVSSELTHFVGRGLPADEQFDLLCKILDSGWLTHPPHEPRIHGNLKIARENELSSNEMYNPQVVCFCDIPVADLGLHAAKYSPFGIAFSKQFLVTKGAAPVFYVPRGTAVRTIAEPPDGTTCSKEDWRAYTRNPWKTVSRASHFDEHVRLLHKLLEHPRMPKPPEDPAADDSLFWKELRAARSAFDLQFPVEFWLDFHVFSYMKFFDLDLSDSHSDNYYFEREWRVVDNVQFALEDVSRVCFPREFSADFGKRFPQFYGQRTFLEAGA